MVDREYHVCYRCPSGVLAIETEYKGIWVLYDHYEGCEMRGHIYYCPFCGNKLFDSAGTDNNNIKV